MPMTPREVALVDQTRAMLDDLLGWVRLHRTECAVPDADACVGGKALGALLAHPDEHLPLLCLALVALADLTQVSE